MVGNMKVELNLSDYERAGVLCTTWPLAFESLNRLNSKAFMFNFKLGV